MKKFFVISVSALVCTFTLLAWAAEEKEKKKSAEKKSETAQKKNEPEKKSEPVTFPSGNTTDWRKKFVPDQHTVLLLHADMGTEGKDASKTESHVGRYVGNVELCRGKFGQAYHFTDWRSVIEIPHKKGLTFKGAQGVTIEFWMKMYKMSRYMSSSRLVCKDDMFSTSISYNRSGKHLHAQVYSPSKDKRGRHAGVYVRIGYPPPDFDYSEWHHYAFVFTPKKDKEPGSRCLFIDGELKQIYNNYVPEFHNSKDTTYIGNSSSPRSHRNTRPFSGALDEIRISTMARYSPTEEQIKNLKGKK